MDDLVLAVPDDKQAYVLEVFKNLNNHIQLFTIEKKNNHCAAFLDTILIRDNNNKIIIYASQRLLSYNSYNPYKMKINFFLALKKNFGFKNLCRVRNILLKN